MQRTPLEFSYKDHQGYHFMDPQSYETLSLNEDLLREAKDYLVENLKVDVLYVEGKAAQVELPSSVLLKVTESAEGVRGDSANNVLKPATLETGKIVNVPPLHQGRRNGQDRHAHRHLHGPRLSSSAHHPTNHRGGL
jgi:elongation factor P